MGKMSDWQLQTTWDNALVFAAYKSDEEVLENANKRVPSSTLDLRYATLAALSSYATTSALNAAIADFATEAFVADAISNIDLSGYATTSALALKAPLASPSFTGTITIGGDVELSRDAANRLYTPDTVYAAGGLYVGSASDASAILHATSSRVVVNTTLGIALAPASGSNEFALHIENSISSFSALEDGWYLATYSNAGAPEFHVAGFDGNDGGSFLVFTRDAGAWVATKGHADFKVDVNTAYHYKVDGVQVVGNQGSSIADASGGSTVDAEARAAINSLLAACRTHGLIAT